MAVLARLARVGHGDQLQGLGRITPERPGTVPIVSAEPLMEMDGEESQTGNPFEVRLDAVTWLALALAHPCFGTSAAAGLRLLALQGITWEEKSMCLGTSDVRE